MPNLVCLRAKQAKQHVFKGGNRSSFQVPKNPRNFAGKLQVAGGAVPKVPKAVPKGA